MINLEKLRKGPEELKINPPVLTLEQVQGIIEGNIQAAEEETKETCRFLESGGDTRKVHSLFTIEAGEEFGTVFNQVDQQGLFAPARLQEMALGIMSKYGFDPEKYVPEYTSGGFNFRGVSDLENGLSREFLIYPSQTNSRLLFKRWRDFYTETGETIIVNWTVEGNKRSLLSKLGDLVHRT